MATIKSLIFTGLFWTGGFTFMIFCWPFLLLPARYTFLVAHVWGAWATFLLRTIIGLTYEVSGEENVPDGPVIYAIKHQSSWETIVFNQIFYRPYWVMKRELFFVPVFGWFMWKSGVIGLDRSAGASAIRQLLKKAKTITNRGDSIFIFPEGSRTEPGVAGDYQPGVAALYSHLKIPVVPVALNSGVFWGRRDFAKKPGTIRVQFLEPIGPGLKRPEFMTLLQDRIEERSTALYREAKIETKSTAEGGM